ncbi:acyltransferase [Citrobacter sp. CK198]|uniref:acyltransferase family protein n=1 Tax=Citrobacter sp. CK198 TaxID=2985107 RepID=UPI00257498BB|nr:acyltransferase [Citrobacter sp. CK198]MDM2973239.1 acyltransferase [Citrobacter sp. CK198]
MNEQNHLNRLDHIRFYAATLVVFYHFRGKTYDMTEGLSSIKSILAAWINNGSSGVSLFLVMSGFLFCIISGEGSKKINYLRFLQNRVLRIFPLLTVVFFTIICVTRPASSPEDILRLLTLQLNTGPFNDKIFPVGPIWTIAVEFQFYLIFPFLAAFMHRYGYKQIILLIACAVIVKLGIVTIKGDMQFGNLYNTITGRLDQFLIGMLFGLAYNRIDSVKFISSILVKYFSLVASLIALTLYFLLDKSLWFRSVIGFSIEGALWGWFIVSYLKIPFTINRHIDGLLCKLGTISFSMYLLHFPIGEALKASGLIAKSGLSFVESAALIILPTVILISTLTYHAIEKPFLSMKVRYLS